MLTIKRRSEKRTLYLYSSTAVIVGFAGIMTFLVHSNANLSEFVSVAPTQSQPTEVIPAVEEKNQTETDSDTTPATTNTGTGQNWSVPMMGSSDTTTVTPTQPAVEQPAPATTTPTTTTTPEVPATTNPETPVTPTPAVDVSEVVDGAVNLVTGQ